MIIQGRRYLASPFTSTPTLLKSLGSSARSSKSHTPEAIIVHPGADYEGDVIHPDGGDWSRFERNPVVNWEHGPYIGTGSIVIKSIPLFDADDNPTGEYANVPVGTTKLFESAADLQGHKLWQRNKNGDVVGKYSERECLETAERVAGDIGAGIFDGMSVELIPKSMRNIGPSPLDPRRQSIEITAWDGITYAHCINGAHPSARQVPADGGYWQSKIEKSIRLLESLPAGTPYFRKSLTRFVERETGLKRTSVRVTKALPPVAANPPEQDEDYAYAGGAGDVPDPNKGTPQQDAMTTAESPDAEPVPIGIQGLMQGAQAVADAVAQMLETLKASDNPKVKKRGQKASDRWLAEAASLQKWADGLGQSLNNGGDGPPDDEDDAETDEPPDDADPPAEDDKGPDAEGDKKPPKPKAKGKPDADEDGGLVTKSFPAYRPRRLKKSDLRPPVPRKAAAPVQQTTDPTPVMSEADAKLVAEIKRKMGLLSL